MSARWRFHPTTSTSPRVPTTSNLRVFDAATGQKLHDSNHDSDVDSVVFSPDNNKIAIGSGRKVTIYDLDKEVKTVLAQNKNTDNKKDYTLKDYALNKSDIGPVLAIVDYLGGMGDLLKKLESRYDPTGDILEEFRDEIFKQHKAATKIQAGFRGMRNRKRVKEILKGKLVINNFPLFIKIIIFSYFLI